MGKVSLSFNMSQLGLVIAVVVILALVVLLVFRPAGFGPAPGVGVPAAETEVREVGSEAEASEMLLSIAADIKGLRGSLDSIDETLG